MAGELVERMNWWAAKRKPPKGMETLPADCREAADRIEALERENATLRAALEPFAKYKTADGLPNGFLRIPDQHPVLFNGLGDQPEFVITIGDFRRAAAIRNMGGKDEADEERILLARLPRKGYGACQPYSSSQNSWQKAHRTRSSNVPRRVSYWI